MPHLLRRLWLRSLATAGVLAAVLLSWWWRIEAARAPDIPPEIGFGQPVAAGRVQLTPQEVLFDGAQIVLRAELLNQTGATLAQPFDFPPRPPDLLVDGTSLPPPELVLLRDGEPLGQLQPRLPEAVALAWPAPPDWQPEMVEIRFSRQTFKLHDNLYGKASWLGFTPSGRLLAVPETAP